MPEARRGLTEIALCSYAFASQIAPSVRRSIDPTSNSVARYYSSISIGSPATSIGTTLHPCLEQRCLADPRCARPHVASIDGIAGCDEARLETALVYASTLAALRFVICSYGARAALTDESTSISRASTALEWTGGRGRCSSAVGQSGVRAPWWSGSQLRVRGVSGGHDTGRRRECVGRIPDRDILGCRVNLKGVVCLCDPGCPA
jgi:hypothetical protein